MELNQETAEPMDSVERKTNHLSMPEGWEAIPLGEFCDFSNGVNANKEAYGSGVPFVNVLEVVENSHIEVDDIPGKIDIPEKMQRKYSVDSSDILFNRTSETREEVGLAAVYEGEEPVVFGGFVIRARMISEVLEERFAGYALRAPFVRKQIASSGQGAIRANISQKELSKVEVPVPPSEEQEAIAEALSDIDALLATIDKTIEKKRNVKTATMQRLLTGEERLPEFEGKWKSRPLGNCLTAPPKYGVNAPAVPYNDSLPTYIRITDITEEGRYSPDSRVSVDVNDYEEYKEFRVGDVFHFLRTANNPRRDLSPKGNVQYLHYGDLHTGIGPHLDCRDQPLPTIEEKKIGSADWIQDGDLVIADASEDYEGVGKSVEMRGVNGKNVVAGLHTLLLRGREDALADGFKGYIQYIPDVRRKLRRIATGTSVYGLSKSKLRDVDISLPERDEQRAIAEILSDMDAEIEAWEKRRAKTEAVKTGMMQELMMGKTRLA